MSYNFCSSSWLVFIFILSSIQFNSLVLPSSVGSIVLGAYTSIQFNRCKSAFALGQNNYASSAKRWEVRRIWRICCRAAPGSHVQHSRSWTYIQRACSCFIPMKGKGCLAATLTTGQMDLSSSDVKFNCATLDVPIAVFTFVMPALHLITHFFSAFNKPQSPGFAMKILLCISINTAM